MSRRANEERAKRIEQYYIRHDKNKKKTYLHFMDEGLSKKTVYHILRRHDQRGDVSFKKPTGRRVSVCTPEMFDKLANLFKDNPDLSCREAAKMLGVARTTIFRIMAKMREKNLETYKIIESEPRCPTCHQKIDPSKAIKPKPMRAKKTKKTDEQEANEDVELHNEGDDDDEIDEDDGDDDEGDDDDLDGDEDEREGKDEEEGENVVNDMEATKTPHPTSNESEKEIEIDSSLNENDQIIPSKDIKVDFDV